MRKKRNKKQILFIVIVGAVILVLLAMVAGFIFSSKYASKISRIFLDLNPFKPEQDNETQVNVISLIKQEMSYIMEMATNGGSLRVI